MTLQDSLLSANLTATYRDDSAGELSPPSGLCFSSEGHLLIADDFNHRIQVFDSQSNFLHCFGSKGKKLGQFQYPKGIAVDHEGNIYVADSWNHRIQKFNAKGTPLLAFGACGDMKGFLNEPYDILVEPSGNLIVVERYNHRIQFFDPKGVSLGWVGDRGTVLEEQLAELQGTPPNILSPPLFELPTSIAKDSIGNYFITDSGNHRIRKFDPLWKEIISFGEKGSEPGQFQYPLCVTVGPNDLLYIADLNNERIQVFSPFGQYLFDIDGTSQKTFEAPCLAAIDLEGYLHIGSTFNTRIFKYLIPLASQSVLTKSIDSLANPDPAHVFYHSLSLQQGSENRKAITALEKTLALLNETSLNKKPVISNLKMDVALELSQIFQKGSTIIDTAFLSQIAKEQLKLARDKLLNCFGSWNEEALKFQGLLHKEQRIIAGDPDGLREFNLDLHVAEQEERKLYRLSRNAIYSYRKTVRKFSRLVYNLIMCNSSETQSQLEALIRQTNDSLSFMKEYFAQKEKNEESMVQILGESKGEGDKLSTFLTQYHSNCRVMDLQQHLQFELQAHWFNLRTLISNTSENIHLKSLAGKTSNDASAFEDILKVLIGFHEDWPAYSQLEQQFLNSLDTLLRIPATNITTKKTDLTLADFEPIPYDSESLNFSGILAALKAEGSSLICKNETLVWGQDELQFSGFSEYKEELLHCASRLMETQTTFQVKAKELLQQLEKMLLQQRDLDVRLKQTRVEDKVSPITLNDNIAIVKFQINLIRRMIMSLDINQSLNLYRLVLAGAFLFLADKKDSDTQQFCKAFNEYYSQQDQKVRETAKSHKENTFKISALDNQARELDLKYNIDEISDSLRLEDEKARIQIDLDLSEFEHQRNSRIKNILDQLVKFRDNISLSGNSPKISFREIRILEIANVGVGHTLAPKGIQYNQDGNLLVANYDNHRVYSYSPTGNYQFHFGGWGSTPEKLQYPNNLAIDSEGSIYVIEEQAKIIKKFSPEGTYLLQFGIGQLGMIFSLSIDHQDNIWVADPEHNRIIIFDHNGTEIRTIPGANQPSSLSQPVSIYCLPKGKYLVGDRSKYMLKYFDSQDNLIHKVDKTNWGVDEIYFLAWHPKHGIYGSDFWNSQIAHFNDRLEVQNIYRRPGRRAEQLGKVGGLSIFNDQLAVANYDGGKVQIFDLSS
jgi:DNA-binding beta-propeller fold protein YncE